MKFLFLALFFSFLSLSIETQGAVGTSTASATVIAPIAIATTTNMNFGRFAAGTGGTVIISTAGVRSKTGGVTLITTGSTVSQAVFNVTGQASATYSILLPTTVNLTSGANTMALGSFVSNPATTGTLSTTGAQVLNVGATLTVAANKPAGAYTGSFTVTVDYN